MSTARDPDGLRALARAADDAAERVRPWQVGHELAKALTANDRSMTQDEVAVVQALERMLNWADGGDHQTFQAWWLDEETSLEEGPADPVVTDALARALEHFHHRRYDEALHVALPRVERLLRHLGRSCGVATTKRPTKRVGGIRGLGEILHDLHGHDGPLLPEPFLTASELTLTDPDSLNLRNNFLHGISNEARPAEAALVLQIGLALALHLRLRPNGPVEE